MMMKLAFIIALCMVGMGDSAVNTVTELDTSAYVGRWYQTYTNYWSNFFSNLPNPECATADYGALNATYISVRNSNFVTETSERRVIEGVAWIPSLEEPGKLKLQLEGVPVEGDYWVFELGPVINGQYQYSLITDASELQLFVLARDVEEFYKLYDSNVIKTLVAEGFTGKRKGAEEILHPAECEYLPVTV